MLASDSSHRALVKLFEGGTKHSYRKGEYVIRPQQAPPGVFYIESGLVKAYDITKYGEENLLIIRKSGEVLALTWAITEEDRHIIYEAIAPTICWQISKEHFQAYTQQHPETALPLLDLVTNMYRVNSQRILSLEYRSVRERLIAFLLNMAERFGVETLEGLLVDVPLKHQDIASSINATRETTSRAITKLEELKLLTNKQSHFVLLDVTKLKHYL